MDCSGLSVSELSDIYRYQARRPDVPDYTYAKSHDCDDYISASGDCCFGIICPCICSAIVIGAACYIFCPHYRNCSLLMNESNVYHIIRLFPYGIIMAHAMGPNVAGVIGTAVAAGVLSSIFGH